MSDQSTLIAALDRPASSSLPPELVHSLLSQPPFERVASIHNLRSLSRVSCPSSSIRPDHIYRSAWLHDLDAAGAEALRALGIKRVFDLRSRQEVELQPDVRVEGVEYTWIEPTAKPAGLIGAAVQEEKTEERPYKLEDMYRTILKSHRPIYRAVFEHIRDRPQDPFLFHCYGGKDRTGVLAALVLELAGASPEEITYEYMLTRAGIEPALIKIKRDTEAYVRTLDTRGRERMAAAIETRAETIVNFQEMLRVKYGGAAGYVREMLGFSEDEVRRIEGNLTMTGETTGR